MPLLEAEEIFACLDRHDVRYVLVGGLAAVLHGSPLPTVDADICPSTEPDNLAAAVLAPRHPEVRRSLIAYRHAQTARVLADSDPRERSSGE